MSWLIPLAIALGVLALEAVRRRRKRAGVLPSPFPTATTWEPARRASDATGESGRTVDPAPFRACVLGPAFSGAPDVLAHFADRSDARWHFDRVHATDTVQAVSFEHPTLGPVEITACVPVLWDPAWLYRALIVSSDAIVYLTLRWCGFEELRERDLSLFLKHHAELARGQPVFVGANDFHLGKGNEVLPLEEIRQLVPSAFPLYQLAARWFADRAVLNGVPELWDDVFAEEERRRASRDRASTERSPITAIGTRHGGGQP